MPAIVMEVVSVQKHPNADSLFVYEMRSAENVRIQIVANSTNIYDLGDHAIVAMIGSKLKDKTYIEKTKIRGVESFGMALGKTSYPIGTDLSEEYCLPI